MHHRRRWKVWIEGGETKIVDEIRKRKEDEKLFNGTRIVDNTAYLHEYPKGLYQTMKICVLM